MRTTRQGRQRLAGFAYVWLLLGIAAMGLGLVQVVEVASQATQRARERELLFIGQQFRQAFESYQQASPDPRARELPPSLEALLADRRTGQLRRHLRRIYVDPMTGKAEWGLVHAGSFVTGVHSLSSQRPIKQDNFGPDDAALAGKQRYAQWVFGVPVLAAAASAVAPGASAVQVFR
ncbi:MAG TPA: type II secretion system protein [Burkholderiaceae bacterium]|nr:type II secretion system protein [Burkholderiaceae bacterium]